MANRRIRTLMGAVGRLLAAAVLLMGARAAGQDFVPGRVYIVVPDSVRPLTISLDSAGNPHSDYACLESFNQQNGFTNIFKPFPYPDRLYDGTYSVVFPDSVNLDSLIARYMVSGCIDTATKVLEFTWDATPNDTLYWNSAGEPGEYQWAFDANHTRVNQVWDITTGSADVVIAIIDQGYFWEHPDLIDNVRVNPGEDANENGTFECWPDSVDSNGRYGDLDGIDGDGNGFVDDVLGTKILEENGALAFRPNVTLFMDESDPLAPPTPATHGSFVASVISARTNNAHGLAGGAGGWGAAQGARLVAAVLGGQSFDCVYAGVRYAMAAGADIISMSIGRWDSTVVKFGAWEGWQLAMLDSLLAEAYFDSNIIIVAAAGNKEGKGLLMWPACFGEVELYHNYPLHFINPDRILGVGSLDSTCVRCWRSNYSPELYDFGAPGYHWGTWVEGSRDSLVYDYEWGTPCATSWATPTVSAIAGLVWSAFPELNNEDVVARLKLGAPVEPDTAFRHGGIDAFAAIVNWPESPWDGTVRLYGDVVVPEGETLLVTGNTHVIATAPDFANRGVDSQRVEIIVNGTLVTLDSDSLPVVFESSNGVPGSWVGIRVSDGANVSLENIIVRDAYTGIEFRTTRPCTLKTSLIENCQMHGILSYSDSILVKGCRIQDIPGGYGIKGVTSTMALEKDSVYHCDYGIYLTQGVSGGYGSEIKECRIGEVEDTIRRSGLYLACSSLVWQTAVYGDYSDAAVMLPSRANPFIYECKVKGDTGYSDGIGIFADIFSKPKVRCSKVFNHRDIAVKTYKSSSDLGKFQGGEFGNNYFWDADLMITANTQTVMAEMNYFDAYPDTMEVDSSYFSGPVDWIPHLNEPCDTCGFCCDDTTGGGYNPPDPKLIAQAPPRAFEVGQNYPNPFNPSTVIEFSLDQDGSVELTVFNVLGQRVRTLIDERMPAGRHAVVWDGRDGGENPMPSGVYFYRIRTDKWQQTKKMVVVR